jgi:hypothetical protein
MSEGDCRALKSQYFGRVNANELKHTILSSRPNQQEMILDFLRHLASLSHLVKISISDKRFVLVTKIVDILIETLAFEDGINLYKGGAKIALSNLMFDMTKSLGACRDNDS